MTTSLRQQLADLLKPLLPAHYRFITSEREPGTLSAPTVLIRQRRIEPVPKLTPGEHLVTFVVTIAIPNTDVSDKAEDALDEHTQTLLASLDELQAVAWSAADKQNYVDTGLSYDISLTLTTRKDA